MASTNSLNTPSSSKISYARATRNRNQIFPNKNQAIIINVMDDTPLEEYVYTIGSIVGPGNITYASKLSNSRLCIFFNKKRYC